jgi:hypothetical protein
MSPLILALFSDYGIDRVWRERGRKCLGVHRCRPACYRHGCRWTATGRIVRPGREVADHDASQQARLVRPKASNPQPEPQR